MVVASYLRTQEVGWEPALGLIPRIGVLPHHEHASPQQVSRLRNALPQDGVLLGIDEATCCYLQSGKWQVVGLGSVTIYNGEAIQRYGSGESFRVQ
jgi:cyanophycinase-like exopeptidase